jgi:thioester reductase-like protein
MKPPEPNFDEDSVLDPSIRYGGSAGVSGPPSGAALLTGATGFLGRQILNDLLAYTTLTVFCLVRAPDRGAAISRLKHHCGSRVVPVVGDLACAGLGLSSSEFAELAARVQVVYHSGAQVNLALPYSALKAANVGGTQELLRFCAMPPHKPFHHVSTTKVFGSSVYERVCTEELLVHGPPPFSSGYAGAKWVAERLVNSAAERGLSVSIYRPGMITGHSQTGVSNENDAFSLLIKACLRLAVAPELRAEFHLTPVDIVSRAVVEFSRMPGSAGKAFHLMNPAPADWQQVVQVLETFGAIRRLVPFAEWRSLLSARMRETGDEDFCRLNMLLNSSQRLFSPLRRLISSENTARNMALVANFSYPADVGSLLGRYVEYFADH